jgi:cardiolipin synthase
MKLRRPGRRWLIGAAIGAALVVVGLIVAQDQDVLRVKSPLPADHPGFADYVSLLVGGTMTSGDRYEVLRNGDEIFPAMLDAIRTAKKRISFESFIYADGEVSRTFTAAFAAAARRGVSVRIVLDAFGSSELPAEYERMLREAGVRVVWFNPLSPLTLEEANYRTHRKVLVVDGHLAFTGGVGVGDHWRGNARTRDEWRDTQFHATGPVTRGLEASFYENWLESGGEEAPVIDLHETPRPDGGRSVVVWSNATGGASNVKLLYLLSIAGARRTIDIQSPYVILDESTRWTLDAARARGVRVRVLTEGDRTDARAVKFASRSAYATLLDHGYEIYEYQPTMMHVKVTVVDGVWSVFGSANFDNRSFELNDELTVAVADPDLARTLTRHFEDDVARSWRLTPENWAQRPWLDRVREAFWSLFDELF